MDFERILHDVRNDLNAKRRAYLEQRYYCKQLSKIFCILSKDTTDESEEKRKMIDEENCKIMRVAIDDCRAKHLAYIERKELYEMIILDKLNKF
jgi:hypothetical protein